VECLHEGRLPLQAARGCLDAALSRLHLVFVVVFVLFEHLVEELGDLIDDAHTRLRADLRDFVLVSQGRRRFLAQVLLQSHGLRVEQVWVLQALLAKGGSLLLAVQGALLEQVTLTMNNFFADG
jgi:hypothetical protein